MKQVQLLDLFVQIGKTDTDTSMTSFNWTEFLQNMQELQLRLTETFTVDIDLVEFFNYNGTMANWMDRLWAVLTPLDPMQSMDFNQM